MIFLRLLMLLQHLLRCLSTPGLLEQARDRRRAGVTHGLVRRPHGRVGQRGRSKAPLARRHARAQRLDTARGGGREHGIGFLGVNIAR